MWRTRSPTMYDIYGLYAMYDKVIYMAYTQLSTRTLEPYPTLPYTLYGHVSPLSMTECDAHAHVWRNGALVSVRYTLLFTLRALIVTPSAPEFQLEDNSI